MHQIVNQNFLCCNTYTLSLKKFTQPGFPQFLIETRGLPDFLSLFKESNPPNNNEEVITINIM